MRTRNIFRYLLAIIIALGTTANAMAQQRNLKIYFNQYTGATDNNGNLIPPILLVTDDNSAYDIPAGVTVTAEGVAWAKDARFFEWISQDVNDRLLADYVRDENGNYYTDNKGNIYKKESHMKLNFTNFPYEVNMIQWNKMNDLLSGSITDFFKNYGITTTCFPVSGNGFSHSEEHWAMNLFTHNATFSQTDIPWKKENNKNVVLNGLTSFEINEAYDTKIGIGNWTWIETTGVVDNNIIKGQPGGTYMLKGYITAHAGAVVPTENPKNPEDFHFEYEADESKMVVRRMSGVIEQIKVTGDIPVTVKLMRDKRLVCSYTQTIHVYSVDPTRPEIAIGFENSKKGYDITVGDDNAQIKGIFTANGDNITLSNGTSGYHFEYSEDSNGEIIEIDPLTGVIIAKKEGDVVISAVLKNGETIASNTSTYTLHVFAKDEGLDWHRVTTYYIIQTSNANWHIDNGTGHTDDYNAERTGKDFCAYDWKKVQDLRTNMNLQNTDDWKQITGFRTTANTSYWRAICQKIGLDVKVPKYSDVHFSYTFDGKVANQGGKNYGFEVKNLGVATSSDADTKIKTIAWKANGEVASSGAFRDNPILPTMIVAGAGSNSVNQVDAKTDVSLEKSNANGVAPITDTHYLAIMSYLGINNNNKGDAAFGYKGIPTYTYHATITYYNNDGTGNVWETQTFTSTSKTETKQMYSGKHNLTRNGYELLGFSTNPEATTPEYKITIDKQNGLYIVEGDFCPYDAVNGGGKGPVSLYAVWNKIPDIVTLDPQGGTGGNTQTTAIYGQKLPNGLEAPTKPGYEFRGYYSNANDEWPESQGQDIYYGGKEYYDKDMNGVEPWDKTQGGTIYAHWAPKTYIVTLDADGGVLPKPVVEDNAGNFAITKEESNSVMTIPFVFGLSKTNEIVHSAVKKPGYEFLGWYDSNDVKVIGVEESRNCTITDNGGYWTGGGKVYNYTDNLTLTAHYRKKYKYADNVITFGKDENGNPEKVEADEDWLFSVVNDLVGSAQEVYQKTGQQTMVFDLRESINRWNNNNYPRLNVMQSLQKEEYKDYISPNVLVYFNDNEDKAWYVDNNVGSVTDCYNAVSLDNKCKRLVVTDRYSIKIPTAFSADEASYARDAKVAADDPAKDQAKNSSWGTLCLPYPIENDMETNHVKFYELKSMTNNYMEFSEMAQGAVIPANTPVLYNRTDGDVGSEVRIENWNVVVPMNADYTPVFKSYSDADESIRDWEFRGNLKTTVFYGKGYVGLPSGAQILPGDVYYFKQNKFTYLNPDMDKNGKHYNAAMMTLYPYRAYFYRNTGGSYYSSTKVSAYSILVVGEDGTTLDITNTIFGDGEGDGKIYDLNGIRVMQPVKGRLYIVNGQKKVYR